MGRTSRRNPLQPREKILLEGEFYARIEGRQGWVYLALTHQEILVSGTEECCCIPRSIQHSFLNTDLVAVRPAAIEEKNKGRYPVFMLVLYPDTAGQRSRVRLLLYLQHGVRREEAIRTSTMWVAAISNICLGTVPEYLLLPTKPLLVLINPKSGKGNSMLIWEQASVILQEAGVPWELLPTQGPGHARDIMAKLELDEWRGVLIVSGDGLVHEVYNGLFIRSDWKRSLEFPVGVFPAGSGNALSRSVLSAQGDEPGKDGGLLTQAVGAARGNTTPLDLMLVRTTTDTRVGFLSLGWGLITDIDIDSEHLRSLGSVRFTLYFILRLAKRRVYRGTVSYVPVDLPAKRTIQVPIHGDSDSDWTESSRDYDGSPLREKISSSDRFPSYPRSLVRSANGDPHPHCPPYTELPYYLDNYSRHSIYSTLPPPHLSQTYALSWEELDQRLCTVSFLDLDNHSEHDRQPSKRQDRKSVSSSNALHSLPISPTPTGDPPTAPSPVFPRKVSHNMDPVKNPMTATPLYQDWVTESSDFLCIYVLNLPYIDMHSKMAPDASLDDGVLWLLLIRGNCTRANLIRVFLEIEEGTHVNIPGIALFPVSAVKIQPEQSADSFMSLDGEKIPTGSIQVQSMPGAGRVFIR